MNAEPVAAATVERQVQIIIVQYTEVQAKEEFVFQALAQVRTLQVMDPLVYQPQRRPISQYCS